MDDRTPLPIGQLNAAGPAGTARTGRLTPLQQFTLVVAAVMVVGAVVLGGTLTWLLQRHLDDETVSLTRREVEVHFHDIFPSGIFTSSLTPAEAARFDPMVRAHFGIYDIVQLRLYDRSGRMVYNFLPGLRPATGYDAPSKAPGSDAGSASSGYGSSDYADPGYASSAYASLSPTPTGNAPSPTDALFEVSAEHQQHVHQAAGGGVVLAKTQLAPDENIAGQPLPHVLQVFVPIRQDGNVVGVAEVYRDIEHQFQETRRIQLLAAGTVGVGASLLFVSLLGIFRDSTRRIRRQSEALARSMSLLQTSHEQTLEALAAALETRDNETEGHSERVTRYAAAIGRAMDLSDDDLAVLQRGALLHDIGKIGVSDTILHKPGPLNESEWLQMQRHPEFGARMLAGISFLEGALPVVRHHHERYDGAGYPDGLAGESIPLAARIFAIADTFDAMTSDRPYRRALSIATARDEIERCAGGQFDPLVVAVFLTIPEEALAAIHRRSRTTHPDDHVASLQGALHPVRTAEPDFVVVRSPPSPDPFPPGGGRGVPLRPSLDWCRVPFSPGGRGA
ncbi:MAG: HD-GYP domain-containing protein, partial [Chloroflexota bacterium]